MTEKTENWSPDAMCIGKVALTWARADEVIKRGDRAGKKRTAYHCPVCKAWHVGGNRGKSKKMRWVK